MYYYSYNNGEYSIHKRMIKNKTIKKESKGATGLTIYKCDETDIENMLDGKLAGQYITTLILN